MATTPANTENKTLLPPKSVSEIRAHFEKLVDLHDDVATPSKLATSTPKIESVIITPKDNNGIKFFVERFEKISETQNILFTPVNIKPKKEVGVLNIDKLSLSSETVVTPNKSAEALVTPREKKENRDHRRSMSLGGLDLATEIKKVEETKINIKNEQSVDKNRHRIVKNNDITLNNSPSSMLQDSDMPSSAKLKKTILSKKKATRSNRASSTIDSARLSSIISFSSPTLESTSKLQVFEALPPCNNIKRKYWVNNAAKKSNKSVVISPASYFIQEEIYPILNDTNQIFNFEPTTNREELVNIYFTDDIYANDFYSQVHCNFIGANNSKKEDNVIVSLRKPAVNGAFKCLKTHKKGSEEMYIQLADLMGFLQKNSTFVEAIEDYLTTTTNNFTFYAIPNESFAHDMLRIEKKHPQKQKGIKIALLYSKGGEQTMSDLFNIREASSAYYEFLDLIAKRIQLKNWKRYRGDLGSGNDSHLDESYHADWRGIEIMFHVCLWMNAEQHRRLIGNDIVFLIFREPGSSFDPTPLNDVGTVPQVFCVVEPFKENYRMAVFTRPNIKPYEPLIPQKFSFAKNDIRDFLFTKIYNGYRQALSCPPMNRLFEVPRGSTLVDLVQKYSKESEKERKEREVEERAKKKLALEKLTPGTSILIFIICANSLPCGDVTTHGAPYCIVTINDQKQKTKPSKRHLDPEWEENLVFTANGIDPLVHLIKIEIREMNKKQLIAQLEMSFSEFCMEMGTERWFPLYSENHEEIDSQICVVLEISGPGHAICPACGIYLADDDTWVIKEGNYHTRCLVCQECDKNLQNEPILTNKGIIYCVNCHELLFTEEATRKLTPETATLIKAGSGGISLTDQPHNWKKKKFDFTICGYCGDCLKKTGFECADCKYPCHAHCKSHIPGNCTRDPITIQKHSIDPSPRVMNYFLSRKIKHK